MYRGICSYGTDYIGETIRNSEIDRMNILLDKNSDCVKHFNDHFDLKFRPGPSFVCTVPPITV